MVCEVTEVLTGLNISRLSCAGSSKGSASSRARKNILEVLLILLVD